MSTPHTSQATGTFVASADRALLAAITLVLILSPWPLGSRPPWASMFAVVVVVTSVALWLAARLLAGNGVSTSPAHIPVALFLAWTGLQWLAGWSVYPYGAAYEWVQYFSYALVFVACTTLARQRDVAYRLHVTVIGVGLAVGVLALLQFFTANGRVLWVFEPAYPGLLFGPFNNRNYFAGYMLVALSVAVAALLCGSLRRGRGVVLYLTWIGALALLVCLSRGGMLAFGVACVATLLLYGGHPLSRPGQEQGRPRFRRRHIAIGAGVALLAGLSWTGQADRVFARLETLLGLGDSTSVSTRLALWRDSLPMLGASPLKGLGLGSYMWMLPSYRQETTSILQTNAHNEYLEMAIEGGLVGGVLCLIFLALLFRTGWQQLNAAADNEELGIRLGATAAWIGICVYAVTDFPTVIPAIDYALAVLAALAVARIGPRPAEGLPPGSRKQPRA